MYRNSYMYLYRFYPLKLWQERSLVSNLTPPQSVPQLESDSAPLPG